MAPIGSKLRILFACAGNTCRSVLAEYLTRYRFSQYAEATSAGLRLVPTETAENAIYTLSRLGIDASSHQPRSIDQVKLSDFDFIIAMHPSIATRLSLKDEALSDRLRVWKIADPYGDDLAEYERCAQAITKELKKLFLK